MHRVFVYGTLKRGFQNHRLLVDNNAKFIGSATTTDRFLMNDVGYPLIFQKALKSRMPTQIEGEVYSVDDQCLDALDDLEGEGSLYRRTMIGLQDGTKACAYIWIRTPEGKPVEPKNGKINWKIDMKKTFKDYLGETAEVPFGNDSKPNSFTSKEFTSKGKADVGRTPWKNASVVQLKNVGVLDENEHSAALDTLQKMLNDADCDDDEIKAGIRLSDAGMQTVAARLGVSPKEIPMLINSLQGKLSDEAERLDVPTISEARFSYEKDFLKNVTVRDSKSGKEVFLQGSKAVELLNKLKDAPDDQVVLRQYGSLMESDDQLAKLTQRIVALQRKAKFKDREDHEEVVAALKKTRDEKKKLLKAIAEDDNFDNEINVDSGSYNMPWKVGQQHGNMTVMFGLEDNKPVLDVQSVRDSEGDEMDVPDDMHEELMHQARTFIGKE